MSTRPPLRQAFGRYTTGVTIITCRDSSGQPVGLTANSFASVSLEPALVLWSLRLQSACRPAFESHTHFAVNVLAEQHLELSRHFASSVGNRFDQGSWAEGLGGCPVLAGCAAVFECQQYERHVLGDHLLLVGEVLQWREAALPPLVYQGGHYHMLGEVM